MNDTDTTALPAGDAPTERAAAEGTSEAPEPPEPAPPPLTQPFRAGPVEHDHTPRAATPGDLAKLSLGALGVVYGDIGTSPLYTIKECFAGTHGVAPEPANVLGILSLVFWSLMFVVVFKYLSFIMRADNHGEGGILALLALVTPKERFDSLKGFPVLVLLGLFGAALLYGDGVITPAISVLSAVEGLEVATVAFKPYVVPLTIAILVGLFLVQRRGTATIGAFFGPAMLLWFTSLGVMGARSLVHTPRVLEALNPLFAVHFLLHHKLHGFLVLGAVVLCITGGEALYADMGHFGRRPIRIAWYTLVLPALLLSYFGQGALLLERCVDPASAVCRTTLENPFFAQVSGWVIYPMVILATVATVVASQALISGAFSLTQQAVQLGYAPRVTIVHTSGEAAGQIYIPQVNYALMVACVLLVLMFPASSRLAAAYGIAVTGTMAITSILFYAVARKRWGWSTLKAGSIVSVFLLFDLAFFAANAVKFREGGWFPVAVAVVVFTLMTTWNKGRAALAQSIRENSLPLATFFTSLEAERPVRVRGTAVFMTASASGVPPALMHHFKHNKVLHEQVVLLSIHTEEVPEVSAAQRVTIEQMPEGFWRVIASYGFMQTPNALEVLIACREKGLKVREADTSFFLGRETILTTGRSRLARWSKALFVLMSRNARPATDFFKLPPNRVVELGTQIEL